MTETTEPTSYKKELIIGAAVVLAVLVIVGAIALFIYNSTPKVVYQPAIACDTFTVAEAKEVLGDGTLSTNNNEPVVSGNTATSRCGYTDGNSNTDSMLVAAIIVRSGINDTGVQQNKTEFANGTPAQAVEIIKDLGDSAYFNQTNGQLNILKGRNWFILSNGLGSAPEANNVEDAVKLAQAVLN